MRRSGSETTLAAFAGLASVVAICELDGTLIQANQHVAVATNRQVDEHHYSRTT